MRSDRALLSEAPELREIDEDGFDGAARCPPPAAVGDPSGLPRIGDGDTQDCTHEQADNGESSLLPQSASPLGPPQVQGQDDFEAPPRRRRASRLSHYLYPCGTLSPTVLLVTLLTLTVVHLVLLMQVWRIRMLAHVHKH